MLFQKILIISITLTLKKDTACFIQLFTHTQVKKLNNSIGFIIDKMLRTGVKKGLYVTEHININKHL